MGIDAAVLDARPVAGVRPVYAITEMVAGPQGAAIITALSDSTIMRVELGPEWAPNNVSLGVMFGCLYPTGVVGDYDPAFVAEILAADAEPEEEGFDNVVDLLDWLNRD